MDCSIEKAFSNFLLKHLGSSRITMYIDPLFSLKVKGWTSRQDRKCKTIDRWHFLKGDIFLNGCLLQAVKMLLFYAEFPFFSGGATSLFQLSSETLLYEKEPIYIAVTTWKGPYRLASIVELKTEKLLIFPSLFLFLPHLEDFFCNSSIIKAGAFLDRPVLFTKTQIQAENIPKLFIRVV